jgi:hypothetical protein
VRRINVSLDTRDRALFEQLARRDSLPQVLEGIAAAKAAGSGQAQHRRAQGLNEAELPDLVAWAHGQGHDLTLIEVMPLGEVEGDRFDHYLPLDRCAAIWSALDADGERGALRRPGALCRYCRNRRAAGLHHAADRQFLRGLQPRAGDGHGRCSCAWAARARWTCAPRCAPRSRCRACRRNGARMGEWRSFVIDRPGAPPAALAPHVDDRRLTMVARLVFLGRLEDVAGARARGRARPLERFWPRSIRAGGGALGDRVRIALNGRLLTDRGGWCCRRATNWPSCHRFRAADMAEIALRESAFDPAAEMAASSAVTRAGGVVSFLRQVRGGA